MCGIFTPTSFAEEKQEQTKQEFVLLGYLVKDGDGMDRFLSVNTMYTPENYRLCHEQILSPFVLTATEMVQFILNENEGNGQVIPLYGPKQYLKQSADIMNG